MRCATLAEAWIGAGLGDAIFWGDISLQFVKARVQQAGVPVVEAGHAVPGDGAVICDSYDPDVRSSVAKEKQFDIRVLVDDLGGAVAGGFDAVWNPNAYGSAAMYPGFHGEVLAGPTYVPIRPDIPSWTRKGTHGTAVMLGGSNAIPAPVKSALANLASEPLLTPFSGVGSWVPREWTMLDEMNPWPGIVRCERLITASGVTTWEAAMAGIPVVMLLLAGNQSRIFEWAVASGAPGIDATHVEERVLRERLAAALGGARRLPAIENGAGRVRDFVRNAIAGASR